jgi:hypothetical protein
MYPIFLSPFLEGNHMHSFQLIKYFQKVIIKKKKYSTSERGS